LGEEEEEEEAVVCQNDEAFSMGKESRL